jgi:hypothetical protein
MGFARLNMTYRDYDNEGAQVSFRGPEFTQLTFDQQVALQDDIVTAVEATSLGNLVRDIRIAKETSPGSGPSANSQAQREMKWLVRMVDDTTGRTVNVSIPCPDFSLLLPNSDKMDPASAAYVNLKAAVEAYHQSIEGNSVTVIDVVLVGRNL